MKNRCFYRKMAYGIVAVVIFACLILLTFRGREPEERQVAQIVFLGDSSYGNIRDESSIPNRLGEMLGKTVFNAAFGGTMACRTGETERLDYSGDSLSLVALTKAIYADDFGVQQTIRPTQDVTYYFTGTIDGLESIDFSQVETVLIGHGVNDYCIGAPLDNADDPTDETCFAGALRKSVAALRKVNPNMRIVLLTPTYSWLIDTNLTCEEFDAGGGILKEYVETEIRVAEELGVEVIDLYHDTFPYEHWEDWELYTFDGLHPNEEGRTLVAGKIAAYLKGETK